MAKFLTVFSRPNLEVLFLTMLVVHSCSTLAVGIGFAVSAANSSGLFDKWYGTFVGLSVSGFVVFLVPFVVMGSIAFVDYCKSRRTSGNQNDIY